LFEKQFREKQAAAEQSAADCVCAANEENRMISNNRWYGFVLVCLSSISIMAQTGTEPSVIKTFAVLQKSVDARTSTVGDEVVLTTLSDVVTDNQVVIAKGSKVLCYIAGVTTKGKDEPKSILAIRLDKAVSATGREIPLQGIIAAIAAPAEELTSDPTYAMIHSNEPKMVGSGPRGASGSGTLPASSKANSNAAVATAELKGRMNEALLLNEDSQGAVGYEGISISWHLAFPPPLTVFTTKAKNLKLDAGTQVLIRMAVPRVPK